MEYATACRAFKHDAILVMTQLRTGDSASFYIQYMCDLSVRLDRPNVAKH